MILLTGAGGKTGRAVAAALARARVDVRALVRRQEQVVELVELGAAEATVADMRSRRDLRVAFAGVRAVYHIGPNVDPQESEMGQLAVEVASAEGVEHFALHSVLHPQIEAMPHHWSKLRVEEALLKSGLPFTILQPAPYMQNLLARWDEIRDGGRLRNPYPVTTRLSLVDLEDVAQVAARILTDPGHRGASYQLVGSAPLSQVQVAAALSRALGRPVRAEEEDIKAWESRARDQGMDAHARATLVSMFAFYGNHGLSGNPNQLRWLLGRAPTSLLEFAQRMERPAEG